MDNTNHLYIFCNGNPNVGFGHFSRCLALANILAKHRQEIRVKFIGHYTHHAIENFELANVDFIRISETKAFTDESLKKISFNKALDFLLVDSYIAPQQFYDKLTLMSVKWGVVDDFATHDFSSANLVINFRVGASELFQYTSKRSGLGPGYMPVRFEFLPIRINNEKIPVKSVIKQILICLGGQDIHNISERLLDRVLVIFQHANVILLLADQIELRRLQNKYVSQHRILVDNFRSDIECVLETVDLLISGGGMLKYEACYCGIPNATISQTLKQHQDTALLAKEGLTLNLGLSLDFNLVQIDSTLSGFTAEKRSTMRKQQCYKFPFDTHKRLVGIFDKEFSER